MRAVDVPGPSVRCSARQARTPEYSLLAMLAFVGVVVAELDYFKSGIFRTAQYWSTAPCGAPMLGAPADRALSRVSRAMISRLYPCAHVTGSCLWCIASSLAKSPPPRATRGTWDVGVVSRCRLCLTPKPPIITQTVGAGERSCIACAELVRIDSG